MHGSVTRRRVPTLLRWVRVRAAARAKTFKALVNSFHLRVLTRVGSKEMEGEGSATNVVDSK